MVSQMYSTITKRNGITDVKALWVCNEQQILNKGHGELQNLFYMSKQINSSRCFLLPFLTFMVVFFCVRSDIGELKMKMLAVLYAKYYSPVYYTY